MKLNYWFNLSKHFSEMANHSIFFYINISIKKNHSANMLIFARFYPLCAYDFAA